MAKDIPPPNQMRIIEMDGYIHCWHQCGPGASYASLSKDLSQAEIDAAIHRLLVHVRDCTGIEFVLKGEAGG
jgi:hypothetical protein